jgi:hypothetical protein
MKAGTDVASKRCFKKADKETPCVRCMRLEAVNRRLQKRLARQHDELVLLRSKA